MYPLKEKIIIDGIGHIYQNCWKPFLMTKLGFMRQLEIDS